LEKIANDLPKLLPAQRLRKELIDFSCDVLLPYCLSSQVSHVVNYYTHDLRVLKRTKLIFDYLGQAYVWGQNPPAQSVPIGFAEFWCEVSDNVGMPAILSYDHYASNNWRRFDQDQPVQLGNIAILQNFLGGLDEDGFILIHVDIEARIGLIPAAIISALQAVHQQDAVRLEAALAIIADGLEQAYQTLLRMPEYCDEYIYYTRVRPYIHGWKNNPALPDGLIYDGVPRWQNKPQKKLGESGAQSGLGPSVVALLDIRHTQTKFTPYLKEMRMYMPPNQRHFVETIEMFAYNGCSVLEFIAERRTSHPSLYDAHRNCRQGFYRFRKKHYEYAAGYINKQAQQHAGNPTAVGTAGTPFMTSLKQLLDETWFE
jgi:indoleamine 2,3-dioxygenase